MTDIRLATPADLLAVQEIVETSYAQYIPLIGRRPAPMDADYAAAIEAGQLYVLGHPTLGCLVMFPDGDAIEIDMIAVSECGDLPKIRVHHYASRNGRRV
ncbi:MAG: hypothetical protein EBV86_16600 [Marivivens sp.]|nr:hypothetical protein [Marivivens sp.]